MVRATLVLALGALAVGCGARPRVGAGDPGGGGDVTLYRDRALVRQRVEVEVPDGGLAHVRVRVAAGVDPDDVFVLERGDLTVAEVRAVGAVASAALEPTPAIAAAAPVVATAGERGLDVDLLTDERDAATPAAPANGANIASPASTATAQLAPPDRPVELELVVGARHPGRVALHLGYVTDRLAWDVAYTMMTTPARDAATLRGAIAIRNTAGIELRDARVRVIDADLEAARARSADELATRFASQPGDEDSLLASAAVVAALPPEVPPRELGRLDLRAGETRVELLAATAPRRVRPVLVYDPIGTRCDHTGGVPARDASLGVQAPAPRGVDEGLEIERQAAPVVGLPAGPVRLVEQRPDGSLAQLGEARLFEPASALAPADTVSIGTATGVLGRRERRELTIDDDGRRLVEEFVITIENRRPVPVEVVLREHLYRGQTWTLAYLSVPAGAHAKEGPQQIAPRVTVPPRAVRRVMYVVVYTW